MLRSFFHLLETLVEHLAYVAQLFGRHVLAGDESRDQHFPGSLVDLVQQPAEYAVAGVVGLDQGVVAEGLSLLLVSHVSLGFEGPENCENGGIGEVIGQSVPTSPTVAEPSSQTTDMTSNSRLVRCMLTVSLISGC